MFIDTTSKKLLVFICLAFTSGQVAGENPKLWKWTKHANHLDSIVKLRVDDGQATGVVVQPSDRSELQKQECLVLTAYHVVQTAKTKDSIQVEFPSGEKTRKCKVVAFDLEHDIALLKSWAPKKVVAVKPAVEVPKYKTFLEFAGLGGDRSLKEIRHFSSRATQPTNGKFIYADETLLPGDSGGPVFNRRHQLVGIISGGWFWWDAGIKTGDGIPLLSTWPALSLIHI